MNNFCFKNSYINRGYKNFTFGVFDIFWLFIFFFFLKFFRSCKIFFAEQQFFP